MKRITLIVALLLLIAFAPLSSRRSGFKVGSKKFTESVILGECVRLLAQEAGIEAKHYRELGGTRLVFQALVSGDIDAYPEYTGTISEEILAGRSSESIEAMRRALKPQGVRVSEPLGFNNSYVLAMRKTRAEELGITKISDLARFPDLVLGFGNEFLDRDDGWKNLKSHYGLSHADVRGLDHDLAYRQLQLGAIDVIDAYGTDAKIDVYELSLLEDDRSYFPQYDAVLLYRDDIASSAVAAILRLKGAISEGDMTSANARTEIDRASESLVASQLLRDKLGIEIEVETETRMSRVWRRTLEHLDLVRRSLIPAILIAIPLGILAFRRQRIGQLLLGVVGVIQTIPSLALLVILMPLVAAAGLASVGLGSTTAVLALTLYSLLPIVRNTYTGLVGIARGHREASLALGLPAAFRLVRIELPLASGSILAGIKTAAVMNIGFATLGALIGAGGYGQPIITGIRLNDTGLILEGAIPAAVLAVAVQGVFELVERRAVPASLRGGQTD